MPIRPRVAGLALAFLLVGCVAQVAAPRDASPTVQGTAKPSPTNATTDILYISAAGSAFDARVRVIDAHTGSTIRELPGGVVSRDGSTLYSTDYMAGGTKTQVRVTDLVGDTELRSFTIDGAYRTMTDGFVPIGPSSDRWLVLAHDPYKLDGDYVTQYAVVDTVAGTATSLELRFAWPYSFVALSPDGKRLYLTDVSTSGQQVGTRAYDLSKGELRASMVTGSEWNQAQANGWRSSAVASADGRWLFSVNTSATEAPFVMALDTMGDAARRIPLPADQKAAFEKAMLWSLVATKDGATLYAVNPAIGAVNEIDTRTMAVRRTGHFSIGRTPDGGVLGAIRQAIFPAADAKRLLHSAAVLSLDEQRLYAAGESGLAVIDTQSFAAKTWQKDWAFDLIAMSPDGERLYALANDAWNTVAVISARDGAMLGGIRLPWYPIAIVRVDLGR
jgi:DNA-binding beta-propeller fold protein YncE